MLGTHRVHGFKREVFKDLLADFIPEILLCIEFRRIGRKIQERDVVGNDKGAGAVVGLGAPSRTSEMS
jgi:hypothetical protein